MEITREILEQEGHFIIRPKKHEPRQFSAKSQHFVHEPDRTTLKGHFDGKDRFYNAKSSALMRRLPQYQEYKDDHVFHIPLENDKHVEISAYIAHLILQGDLMPNAQMKPRVIELELSAYGLVLEREFSLLELPWDDVFGARDITDLSPADIKEALIAAVLRHKDFFEKSYDQTRAMAADFDYI